MADQSGYLVVGGPEDGKWYALPPGQTSLELGVLDPAFTPASRKFGEFSVPVQRFRYVLVPFAANGQMLKVLAPADWTADAVLVALLEGYRKPRVVPELR